MSNSTNDQLLERAHELLEDLDSHPSKLNKALSIALEQNDLDYINYLVPKLEAELSQEHFENWNVGWKFTLPKSPQLITRSGSLENMAEPH